MVELKAFANGAEEDAAYPIDTTVDPGKVVSDGCLNDSGAVALEFQPGAFLASPHGGLEADEEVLGKHASMEIAISPPISLDYRS